MVDSKWFVRKLGFGLRSEEEFPTDPVNWAINQMDSVPDAVGQKTHCYNPDTNTLTESSFCQNKYRVTLEEGEALVKQGN